MTMTVRGIVTVLVRTESLYIRMIGGPPRGELMGWYPLLRVPGGGPRKFKEPGTRRRTAAQTMQDRAGVENSSGRSDSRKREVRSRWLCAHLPP